MMELPEITIHQFAGNCRGVWKTEPLDVIVAHTEAGPRKIGFVSHLDNAVIKLIRIFPPEVQAKIRDKVAELRKGVGGKTVAKRIASPPDPKLIRAALKGEKLRERPTTVIVNSDGEPYADEPKEPNPFTQEIGDDE